MASAFDKLDRRMKAIPASVRAAAVPAVVASAKEIAERVRSLAPDDPATGAPDLKSSVHVTGPGETTPAYSQPGGAMTVGELSAVVTVGGSDVRYPHLVEYGTKNAAAQPFFWPSVRLLQKRSKSRIKRAISKAVRENWGS